MAKVLQCALFFAIISLSVSKNVPTNDNIEKEAEIFIAKVQKQKEELANKQAIAAWNYDSDINDEHLKIKIAAELAAAKVDKEIWKQVQQYPWKTFKNDNLKRQFKKLSVIGEAALPNDKLEKLNSLITEMSSIYSTAKICDFKNSTNCELRLNPHLEEMLSKSKDAEELKHIWTEWRKVSGKKCKTQFTEMVNFLNEAARLNNFTDQGEYVLSDYEDPNIKDQFEQLWAQLEPYYKEMHAFVRNKLRLKYGDKVVSEKGPIPAHLLGNMWGQTWDHIAEETLPYPENKPEDITAELKKQNYTPLKLFKLSEDFFLSVNLTGMPPKFWEDSIIERIPGREMVCHASAWDFFDREDFRIKQCTVVTQEDMMTVHHEMGHIEYYLQYKHLPLAFRSGANEGFHEAVGDTIALSVDTRKHLRRIGLLKTDSDPSGSDAEVDLNHLYKTLLSKLAFLPFGYLMDIFRWNVYNGQIKPDDYNCEWWRLRQQYQGLEPPVDRDSNDFDPAGKYHIVANVPYIRYFVSFVIQFQFHKGLCEAAGEYVPNDPTKPLHRCDIYQNKKAGKLMGDMLSLGASKPWPEALAVVTGEPKMNANGLIEYFKPVLDFIKAENVKNKVMIGWESSKRKFGCKNEKTA